LRDSSRNEKRGLVQAPSLELTPQKPEPESRFGSGHPGKPISFNVARRRASIMPVRGDFAVRVIELIAWELVRVNKVTWAWKMPSAYKISQNPYALLCCLGALAEKGKLCGIPGNSTITILYFSRADTFQ
jgi:hypothetical protein